MSTPEITPSALRGDLAHKAELSRGAVAAEAVGATGLRGSVGGRPISETHSEPTVATPYGTLLDRVRTEPTASDSEPDTRATPYGSLLRSRESGDGATADDVPTSPEPTSSKSDAGSVMTGSLLRLRRDSGDSIVETKTEAESAPEEPTTRRLPDFSHRRTVARFPVGTTFLTTDGRRLKVSDIVDRGGRKSLLITGYDAAGKELPQELRNPLDIEGRLTSEDWKLESTS